MPGSRQLPRINELEACWDKCPKDWYSIYNWGPLAKVRHAPELVELLCKSMETNQIKLKTDGLRVKNFKVRTHMGQAKQKHPDDPKLSNRRKEQLLCRAVYNQYNRKEVDRLGTVLDYEVPLKANRSAKHGRIDLLFTRNGNPKGELLCVEAKYGANRESVLKALLEAVTYCRLVGLRRCAFFKEFGVDQGARLRPVVLTFSTTASGGQLETPPPQLQLLLEELNDLLAGECIEPIELWMGKVQSAGQVWATENTPWRPQDDGQHTRIVFRDGVELSVSPVLIPKAS